MKETWKKIPGFPRYKISNSGKLISFVNGRWPGKKTKGHLITPRLNKDGYVLYRLNENNRRYNVTAHRLVAFAFIPNPESKLEVNHKDGDKENNTTANLEWVTKSENHKHDYKIGLFNSTCESNGNAKLNEHQVRRIRLMREVTPELEYKDIARMFGVSKELIGHIVRRLAWKHI